MISRTYSGLSLSDEMDVSKVLNSVQWGEGIIFGSSALSLTQMEAECAFFLTSYVSLGRSMDEPQDDLFYNLDII